MLPYGPYRELHDSDFPTKVKLDEPVDTSMLRTVFQDGKLVGDPNESVPGRFAKIDQITEPNFARYSKVVRAERVSTVAEYHAALVERANNRAGQNIDYGSEPYLFNLESDSFDMHPFQTVHDLMTEKRGGCIGLDLGGRLPVYVTPDTLLVWR